MPKKTETLEETIKKPKRKYTYHSPEAKLKAQANLKGGSAQTAAVARENVQTYRESLANHIRQIGNEDIELKGPDGQITKWKRIDAVVRRLYADAIGGKTAATELLLERGWGKVAAPVQIDLKAEFTQIVRDSGLKWDEVLNDPILGAIAKSAGVEVIEGAIRELPLLEAPKGN